MRETAVRPRELIRKGSLQLGDGPSPRQLCELLLSEILSIGRTALYLEEKELSEETADQFFRWVKGLQEGKPFQYLLGRTHFLGDSFQVSPACFIPRPETEMLVEACLDYFNERRTTNDERRSLLFIDIGTGSGCIAISLTKRLLYSKMLAIDLMEEALRVARQNADSHGVTERISWVCGDLFSPLKRGIKADAILSNPPYIPTDEIATLSPEVQKEPRVSLDGGESGLDYYKRIAEEAALFLKEEGFLFFEIGDRQAGPVTEIFSKKQIHLVEIRKDVSGIPRILIFRKGRYDG